MLITASDKKKLLETARLTISNALSGFEQQDTSDVEHLAFERGVFVTLTEKGMLRGCIGNIMPELPLYRAVIENAFNAAFKDPRFSLVVLEELDDILIEISILSLPLVIDFSSIDELKNKITPFEDGVILTFGKYRKSTFLPQVWEELPDFDEFMGHLSMKAGLDYNAWKTMNPKIEIYKADHFSEKDLL